MSDRFEWKCPRCGSNAVGTYSVTVLGFGAKHACADPSPLDVQPGDTLIVHLPQDSTIQECEQSAAALRRSLPDGVRERCDVRGRSPRRG
jgi:hypothetical protein